MFRISRETGVRAAVELTILVLLTVVFLALFPARSAWVDISLAGVAIGLVLLNARFTREVVWVQFPPSGPDDVPGRCWSVCLGGTGLVTLGLAVATIVMGVGASSRLFNWHILVAISAYLPWALMQQFLFQFYLQGRLLSLLRPPFAIFLTGICYSLVHLPDLRAVAVTAAAGVFWSFLYYRHRMLLPLAISHAVLGASFYYWVCGRDLALVWGLLPG